MEVRPHLHLLQINSLTMPYLFAILYDLKTKAHKISHELLVKADCDKFCVLWSLNHTK